MYSDDYRLLFYNQNCDLQIRFGTTACQRATIVILQPSRSKKFHKLPFKLRSYWTDLHQIFTHCRGFSAAFNAAFNACIHRAIVHSVLECQSEEWKLSISTSAKRPQSKLVTIATSLGLPWNLCQLCNSRTCMYLPMLKCWWRSVPYLLRYSVW